MSQNEAVASVHTRKRWTWVVIAAALPSALLFWGNACFTWNHFLEGPFLQDAGWYSAIMYRRGFFPTNPPAVDLRPEYYSIHVSLAVSLASLLSYAFPGDRVDWYCVLQGAIYAPLGAVVALLVGWDPKRTGSRDVAVVGGAALAFALNGQAFECMGFPHHEILIPVGVCVMLAALGRGRTKLACIGLATAAGAREDGGLHALAFLTALLICDCSKRPFPIRRRLLLGMAGAALSLSVLALVVQSVGFHSSGLFRQEYLGEPAFGHVDSAAIARRLTAVLSSAPFIGLPLLATMAIAIATRDARYLLGWAVELPWFVLNLLAAQDLKSRFEIYTGFPFVASIFWVGVYAHRSGGTRRRALGLLAAVALTSTIGAAWSRPHAFMYIYERAAWPKAIPRSGLLSFSRRLRESPRAYGTIYVDPAVASWSIERLPEDFRLWQDGRHRRGDSPSSPAYFEGVHGFAFFRRGLMGPILVDFLATSPFHRCGAIAGTEVYFCTRDGHTLPPEFEARSLMLDLLVAARGTPRTAEGYEISASTSREVRVFGPFSRLSPGQYEATWNVEWRACIPGDGPILETDVVVRDRDLGRLPVTRIGEPVRIPFELTGPDPTESVELRTWSGRCAVLLRDVRLEKR